MKRLTLWGGYEDGRQERVDGKRAAAGQSWILGQARWGRLFAGSWVAEVAAEVLLVFCIVNGETVAKIFRFGSGEECVSFESEIFILRRCRTEDWR